ncbi:hypothetical protein [Photobacterium swingsii]|uniref:hypothetical protein n=1 Tax=Photobacterium swingsii TaxID=680026 RepID=UPI0040684F3B
MIKSVGFDESQLFISSCETSLFDLLKTDIAANKEVHCTYQLNKKDQLLIRKLIEKKVKWIKFSNTARLYSKDLKIML